MPPQPWPEQGWHTHQWPPSILGKLPLPPLPLPSSHRIRSPKTNQNAKSDTNWNPVEQVESLPLRRCERSDAEDSKGSSSARVTGALYGAGRRLHPGHRSAPGLSTAHKASRAATCRAAGRPGGRAGGAGPGLGPTEEGEAGCQCPG